MKNYINFFEDNKDQANAVWDEYGIGSYIILKHYSSTIDNEAEIRTKGLRSLIEMLRDKESVLSRFLSANGVDIVLKENEGQLIFKGSYCDISNEKPLFLYPKLCQSPHIQNVVECFYYEPRRNDNRTWYACPEILCSIDSYLKEYYDSTLDSPLATAWLERKPILTTYQIACPANLLSLEKNTSVGELIGDFFSNVFGQQNLSSDFCVAAIASQCSCQFLETAPQLSTGVPIDCHGEVVFWRIPEKR